ncbi:alpha-tocopherol transfer protein-like [Dermatophagoides pteronyssinus]|uniref:alpha-tocopherol transfer protein-like n=1 Tax=Dermatophagoides pteronyssinus TaxID=6956 RepID=UPI003F6742EB
MRNKMDKVKPSANHPMPISNNDNLLIENESDIVMEPIINKTTTTFATRLTPELIMRAEMEVNEKDAWRLRDIEALREMIQGEPSLKCRQDDAFLLRFLRARRFDYDGAFRLICDYLTLKCRHQELFMPIEQLKCVFDDNTMTVLDDRSNQDETIFLLRLGQWSPRRFSFDQVIAAAIMSMEYVIRDEVTQINGIICVIDMAGFGWSQLRKFGPSQAKKIVHIMDKCLPIRIKTIYVINESTLADIGFAIMRPFTSEELHDKIIFLGSNYSQILHQNISSEILPNQFNGRCGSMNSDSWYKKLCLFDKEMKHNFFAYGFIDDNNMIIDLRGDRCTSANICRSNNHSNSGNYIATGADMKTIFRKSQTCNGYLFDYYNTTTSID